MLIKFISASFTFHKAYNSIIQTFYHLILKQLTGKVLTQKVLTHLESLTSMFTQVLVSYVSLSFY